MTSRYIPQWVRCVLWGRSAGHCEYCNRPVSQHPDTKETVNLAEVAHIIGFSDEGPRGEGELSEALAKDITNLMLLCGACHKTVDTNKSDYPVSTLRDMKTSHEHRVALVVSIDREKRSHMLLYGANIGQQSSPLTFQKTAPALFPNWYPAEASPISLGLVNSVFRDDTEKYWEIESAQLRSMVNQRLNPRLASGEIQHLAIFGLAPQPLLMLLGSLISDIPSAEVYQLHREPADWRWQQHSDPFDYTILAPQKTGGAVALVLSLSATISDDRVKSVIGEKSDIWRLAVPIPGNDFLQSRDQLKQFRETMRLMLDRIKAQHGEKTVLHLFPAVPVAIAIEFGRVLIPKADIQIRIYDQNRRLGGFIKTIDLNVAPNSEASR